MTIETASGLNEIALCLRHWLDWNKRDRDLERLTTSDETMIMCVPPTWPSRGQLKLWAETIEAARDQLAAPAELPQETKP